MKVVKKKCSVKGCARLSQKKKLCCAHYERYRKYGKDFDKSLIKPIRLIDRFKRKMSKKDANGCIEVPGTLDQYGYVKFYCSNSKYMTAHRLSYLLFVGEIVPKFYVCHTCDNIKCVNPEHLYIGNYTDQKADRQKGVKNAG